VTLSESQLGSKLASLTPQKDKLETKLANMIQKATMETNLATVIPQTDGEVGNKLGQHDPSKGQVGDKIGKRNLQKTSRRQNLFT
jgi:hypothetical protein